MARIDKYTNDLERYAVIAKYFEDNPGRIIEKENIRYLDNIKDYLKNSFSEKIGNDSPELSNKSKELVKRLEELNLDKLLNKLRKLKSKRVAEGKEI